MALTTLDFIVLVLFTLTVVGVALYASRKEQDEADYFLAGRDLDHRHPSRRLQRLR